VAVAKLGKQVFAPADGAGNRLPLEYVSKGRTAHVADDAVVVYLHPGDFLADGGSVEVLLEVVDFG